MAVKEIHNGLSIISQPYSYDGLHFMHDGAFRKLGIKDERNGFRQVPMALHVTPFVGMA
jgi:hypothetical protein